MKNDVTLCGPAMFTDGLKEPSARSTSCRYSITVEKSFLLPERSIPPMPPASLARTMSVSASASCCETWNSTLTENSREHSPIAVKGLIS